jgi:hypothetical protein
LRRSGSGPVDTIAPGAPSIASSPRNPTNVRTATFAFSGGEPRLRYACRLDGTAFAACTSPVSYRGLSEGAHGFAVRATDAAGNVGPVAARTWVLDTLPPTTTITSASRALPRSSSASFAFTSSETSSSFTCSLDGAGFVSCTSPRAYSGLADGDHTFRVRATDRSGNSAPLAASRAWRIEAPPGTVRRLRRTVDYGLLKLNWSLPSDTDFDHVQVLRSRSRKGPARTVVYEGRASGYVDKRFQNGTYYRYRIRSYDHSGNASTLVPVAVPPSVLLRSPRAGAIVTRPPLLLWATVPRARYYNVQVYRGGQKLLTLWPNRARLRMTERWVYGGRQFRLARGTYTWWLWPGFGPRAKGTYGHLLGTARFVVR